MNFKFYDTLKDKISKLNNGGLAAAIPLNQPPAGKGEQALKVDWYKSQYSLCEISQQTGIVFSFLSSPKDGSKQCHPWIKCRDFLHDAVRAQMSGKPCSIFGFNFGPKVVGTAPIDMRRTRMLVSQQAMLNTKDEKAIAEFDLKMKFGKRLLNHYEKMAGVGYTKLIRCKDGTKNFWVFNGPAFWQKSPVLTSMFTFLIRLGDKKVEFTDNDSLVEAYKALAKAANKDNDINYIAVCGDKMHKVIDMAAEVLLEGKNVDSDYFDKKIAIGTFHNTGGIRSFCAGNYFNKSKSQRLK